MSILQSIKGHRELAALDAAQRKQLCEEIREFLISHVARTGGHIASNLGVVELTVALETVYNTQVDRLVFDVGHQCYVHKILTGRQAEFDHLRQFGGMAGFPKPSESKTDAVVAGHASSAVSIALGMARARTLQKKKYNVVALLGDGSATGGMAYEALNNAAVSKEPMVIVLNDNEMSIDRSVGGLARHLSRLRTRDQYLQMKADYQRTMDSLPGGQDVLRVTKKMKDSLKHSLLGQTIFEKMGLAYLGPVDGHDTEELIRILKLAKKMNVPVVVHVITQKGKGYAFAEQDPERYHGVSPFNPETGCTASAGEEKFSNVFGEELVQIAAENPKVCAITAAMPSGTGLTKFAEAYPERFFDVAIAEEHAVSMAGGLAKAGMVPVVAIYSTFLQRAYDQILQDIAILHLHVVLAVDRAGLVGDDGETHHGVFDVGFLRQVPGMQILCPGSAQELRQMLRWATCEYTGPVAIRYPRGADSGCIPAAWPALSDCLHPGEDVNLITYGSLTLNAMRAAEILEQEGIRAAVYRLTCVAPLPEAIADESIPTVIVEETMENCGIAQTLANRIHTHCPATPVRTRDLGGSFVQHGSNAELYRSCGMDAEGIARLCREVLGREE